MLLQYTPLNLKHQTILWNPFNLLAPFISRQLLAQVSSANTFVMKRVRSEVELNLHPNPPFLWHTFVDLIREGLHSHLAIDLRPP